MTRRGLFLVVLALFTAGSALAQGQGQISGTVTSGPGAPLSGATVTIPALDRSSVTDAQGRYTLASVPAGTHQVRAGMIGYGQSTQPVAVAAGQTATQNFTLASQVLELEGLVAVGYGTQQRRDVTGAVASVRGEDITQVVAANPADAIKGRIPGVDVVTSSFEPGAATQIRVRGTRSISAGNNPLFVVDGVPISGDLRDFDANSIESIEVLKDASAAAVYGSRGANGVILVTTKRGRAGGTQFDLSSSYGTSRILNRVDMMNAQEFADCRREAYRAVGQYNCPGRSVCEAGDAVALDPTMRANLAAGVDTDWQDQILRTGVLQNHQLAVSGGSAETRFRVSAGFLDQTGITLGQAYEAKNGSVSLTHDFGRLGVQATAHASQTLREAGRGAGLWDEALFNSPLGRVRDEQGNLVFLPTEDALRVNPVSEAIGNVRELERTNVLGTLSARLEVADGVQLVSNFGPEYSQVSDGFFVGSLTRANRGGQPNAGLDNTRRFNYTLSNYLQLDRDFGDAHRVQGTLLYEVAGSRMDFDSATASNLPYEHQLWYNLGSGQRYAVGTRLEETTLQSYMGRVNYTLLDRYTFTLTGRVDGSSVLAEGNKYAFFPSAAFAWRLADEPFLSGLNAVSDLKLRVSYGRTGNSAIGPYQTLGQLTRGWYTFGANAPAVPGYRPGAIPNPDLKWETTDQYNVGLDFGFFDQRVTGTVDLYRQDTHDLLLTRALPYTSGFSSVLQNVGETQNRGIELGLSTVNLEGWHGLDWETDFNVSANRNEIVRLADDVPFDVGSGRWVGQPINVNHNYRFEGIWQAEEAAAAAAMGFRPGDIKVADLNGDGRITGDDRTFVGNHYNFPTWQGSLNNRFRFGSLDLSVLATARYGYMVNSGFVLAYTNLAGRFNNVNVDYWTPENPSDEYPRPSTAGVGNYLGALALQDGSHVRIRDITLGYAIPESLLGHFGGQRARVFVRAQDPFVFTKYEGWDPEAGFNIGDGNSTASQIDVGGPAYRTFMLGVDLTF